MTETPRPSPTPEADMKPNFIIQQVSEHGYVLTATEEKADMNITTGSVTYEVTEPQHISELAAQGIIGTGRTRGQILASLAELAAESEQCCPLLSETLRTIARASRYPVEIKSHLVSVGRHMVEAYGSLARSA